MKSFLKYPGGKSKLSPLINKHLGEGSRLIEPFVGAGNVFINTDYDKYLLNDINKDIIDTFHYLRTELDRLMTLASGYFTGLHNTEEQYYRLRALFNTLPASVERSALFIYLNRHGYNGLVRYNQSGGFNVPYGRYRSPYFPEKEMEFFAKKLKRATLICGDFGEAFRRARKGTVVMADPPYFSISDTANFTSYSGGDFGMSHQKRLNELSLKAMDRGVKVVITNHDLPISRQMYSGAKLTSIEVGRSISCKTRGKVKELIAVYG